MWRSGLTFDSSVCVVDLSAQHDPTSPRYNRIQRPTAAIFDAQQLMLISCLWFSRLFLSWAVLLPGVLSQ